MLRRELTDVQWERISDLVPGKASDCGSTGRDNRLFVDAVLWIARTSSPWRDLPDAFGNWNSVYVRFFPGGPNKGHGRVFSRPWWTIRTSNT